MSTLRLSPTSYIVLGFVRLSGAATPYDLKQAVALSVGNFWTFPHSQLYAEPERLAAAGYLAEQREQGGRRRKSYRITKAGERALEEWLAAAPEETYELRDPALLKLFFGADPKQIARAQVDAYRERLAEYERMHAAGSEAEGPRGPLLALENGIEHARASIAYWERIARA